MKKSQSKELNSQLTNRFYLESTKCSLDMINSNLNTY